MNKKYQPIEAFYIIFLLCHKFLKMVLEPIVGLLVLSAYQFIKVLEFRLEYNSPQKISREFCGNTCGYFPNK